MARLRHLYYGSPAMPHLSEAAPEHRALSPRIALFSLTIARLEIAELLCLCHDMGRIELFPEIVASTRSFSALKSNIGRGCF